MTWLWAAPALIAAVMIVVALFHRRHWIRRFLAGVIAWMLMAIGAALGINYHSRPIQPWRKLLVGEYRQFLGMN